MYRIQFHAFNWHNIVRNLLAIQSYCLRLYMIQSNVSVDAFAHFMVLLDNVGPQCSPETIDDLMLFAREFGPIA
jgi:hypothetical protein